MKKIIVSIMMVLLLVGCGSKKEDEPVKIEEKPKEELIEKEVTAEDLVYASFLPMYTHTSVKKSEYIKDGNYANTWIELKYIIDGIDVLMKVTDNGYLFEFKGTPEDVFIPATFIPYVVVSNDTTLNLTDEQANDISINLISMLSPQSSTNNVESGNLKVSVIASNESTTIFINKK